MRVEVVILLIPNAHIWLDHATFCTLCCASMETSIMDHDSRGSHACMSDPQAKGHVSEPQVGQVGTWSVPNLVTSQSMPKSVDTRWYQRLPHEDDIPVSHWENIIVPERLFIRQTLANMQA